MPTGNPLIEVHGLSYSYPERTTPALSEIDMEIEAGEFVVLAGTSGGGKSTLLRTLAGLVPHFFGGAFTGEVTLDGLDTRDHGPNVLADSAASLFQDPETQVVMNSVEAELSLALEQRGWSGSRIARAGEEVSLATGITALRGRETHTLSGGELQRVALASVLVPGTKVVLLDEPTSQLDPHAADELFALLHRLNSELGMTVVMSEQRLERCLPYADRVIALEGGRIVCDNSPQDFLTWAVRGGSPLATPLARMFSLAGLEFAPASVKSARKKLAEVEFFADAAQRLNRQPVRKAGVDASATNNRAKPTGPFGRWSRRRNGSSPPNLILDRVWHAYSDSSGRESTEAVRNLSLTVSSGERVALMGRNGAGKSTLLRLVKGLLKPIRGGVEISGEVALLLQNPNDYFLHDRVRDEFPATLAETILAAMDLQEYADACPHDLSAGQRQRLALAIVLAGSGWPRSKPASLVAFDEPTRGIDRAGKDEINRLVRCFADEGSAVMIATHDVEFAASFASRVVLMADGEIIADGPPEEILCGGWYYSTDVARVLGINGVIAPESGAAVVRAAHGLLAGSAP